MGAKRVDVEPGVHFGSRFPGDPARLAVYDFLPDPLLDKVVNLPDFLGILVFDKWMGNADARQAIFFRSRIAERTPAARGQSLRVGMVAQMIDHGYVFDGPHWIFHDSPLQGLYFRKHIYRGVRALDSFQPWLDRVTYFPEDIVDQALKRVPPAWLDGEREALEGLLERLIRRRRRVPDLIEDLARGKSSPFAGWSVS